MGSKHIVNKCWKFVSIFIAVMALVVLYKIDIFARVIANKDVYSFIEITSTIFITAALLYILMLLMDMFKRE